MSKKHKDGNLISFKVLVDYGGTVVTELSGIPEDKLHEVFKGEQLQIMRKLLRVCNEKLKPLHDHIEDEMSAWTSQPI